MAYTPTEWETGDVITAEKLNNMEQGIEDASLVTDKKTFIYNLTADLSVPDFSMTLDENSPVPTVEDFEHPERNQVKVVAVNQFTALGAGYLALFLPLSMISSISTSGSQPNYKYSRTAALGTGLADFTVQFYPNEGEVTASLFVTFPS